MVADAGGRGKPDECLGLVEAGTGGARAPALGDCSDVSPSIDVSHPCDRHSSSMASPIDTAPGADTDA